MSTMHIGLRAGGVVTPSRLVSRKKVRSATHVNLVDLVNTSETILFDSKVALAEYTKRTEIFSTWTSACRRIFSNTYYDILKTQTQEEELKRQRR